MPVLQPRASKLARFGLFRVRSPLLAEWSLFLWVLRCLSSPGSPPRAYGFSPGMIPNACASEPGFPIRTSPDGSLHTASRGLSQCSTSFIGTWRQGIHRKPLVASPRDAEKLILFGLQNIFRYFLGLSFIYSSVIIQLVRFCSPMRVTFLHR